MCKIWDISYKRLVFDLEDTKLLSDNLYFGIRNAFTHCSYISVSVIAQSERYFKKSIMLKKALPKPA
jgi:hypothetical protein